MSLRKGALHIGLRSPGRLSDLENGAAKWPTDLAIEATRRTNGEVTVAELRPDLHDVRVVRPTAGAPA
ncbi:MAG: hypothetical protein EBR82_02850 [Caulobacteraceae bacterium]|nr:hypothetical protein [Caulobacteraceae bacterium]